MQTYTEHLKWKKKGWKLIDPGSAAGLDGSIAKASDSNEPWFGYYWNPTSMVGKYNLNQLILVFLLQVEIIGIIVLHLQNKIVQIQNQQLGQNLRLTQL